MNAISNSMIRITVNKCSKSRYFKFITSFLSQFEDASGNETSESDTGSIVQDEMVNNSVTEENVWRETIDKMKEIPFTKTNTFLVDLPGEEPYDWFRLLMDDELLDMIVSQTNNYAIEVLSISSGRNRSRISKWKDLTKSELLVFLGLTFHTGTIKLPRVEDYWKTHRLFSPCFS